MENHRATVVGWYHATAAAILPWVGVYRPEWLPVAILLVVVVHRAAMRSAEGEPWRSLGIGVSALGVLVLQAGWAIAGAWLLLAVALGSAVLGLGWLKAGARPDVLDLAAAAVWATVMAIRPELLTPEAGGWIAPLLLILGVRRGISRGISRRLGAAQVLGPPSREVRGTLGFSGVVAGSDGLARSVALEFEVRAGTSLAILSDDSAADDLAVTLMGLRPVLDGQLSVDGVPPNIDDRLIAKISPGEDFVVGGLDENVCALFGENLEPGKRAAIFEACSLGEVEEALGDRPLQKDGSPLESHHRLLLQAARVVASHYRILVVADPMAWVNPVRAELWRNAVVRASVGRTAVWITADHRLAERAERVLEFRHGTLRSSKGD